MPEPVAIGGEGLETRPEAIIWSGSYAALAGRTKSDVLGDSRGQFSNFQEFPGGTLRRQAGAESPPR